LEELSEESEEEEEPMMKDVLQASRDATGLLEVALFHESALGLYQALKVDLPQPVLLKLVLLMLRAEEEETMGKPWSSFLEQMDSSGDATARETVDAMLGFNSKSVAKAVLD